MNSILCKPPNTRIMIICMCMGVWGFTLWTTKVELHCTFPKSPRMAHSCDPSTQEAEAGGSWVWGQPGVHGETLFPASATATATTGHFHWALLTALGSCTYQRALARGCGMLWGLEFLLWRCPEHLSLGAGWRCGLRDRQPGVLPSQGPVFFSASCRLSQDLAHVQAAGDSCACSTVLSGTSPRKMLSGMRNPAEVYPCQRSLPRGSHHLPIPCVQFTWYRRILKKNIIKEIWKYIHSFPFVLIWWCMSLVTAFATSRWHSSSMENYTGIS
jgi:hypothetical protein